MGTDAKELVERMFTALAAGDVATMNGLLADDIRFTTGGSSPISGVAEGKAAVFEKMQKIGKLTNSSGRLELVTVTSAGPELALVHARRHADAQGRQVSADVAMVCRAAGDRIVEVADVMEQALDDFWTAIAGNASG